MAAGAELVRLGRGRRSRSRPHPPSIFIVGDRKQSIYGFRDAEVTVLDAAARSSTRCAGDAGACGDYPQLSIRARAADVRQRCVRVDRKGTRLDAFRYTEADAFPATEDAPHEADAIGVITANRIANRRKWWPRRSRG